MAVTERAELLAQAEQERAAEPKPRAPVEAAHAKAEPEVPKGSAAPTDDDASETDESGPAAANATAAPAFEGLYAGNDIAVFRLSGFPEREQRDDKAKIRIEKAASGSVSITLINSEDGSDLCELMARVDGNAALIESAQPCFSDGSEGSLEAQLTAGRAVLTGDRLRMEAEGTLSVALPDQELDGELTYSFKGQRE